MVEVSLTVGKLDASLALLLTEDHHLIEFPTILLPNGVKAGSIVKIKCEQDFETEQQEAKQFQSIQDEILNTFGKNLPLNPVLKVKNVTQTSCVLEWEDLNLGTATLKNLFLYKGGKKLGAIPQPLTNKTTKLSGLPIDQTFEFQLKLDTTAGVYTSDILEVTTHKMTDLSGIKVCLGDISPNEAFTIDDIEETLKNMGAHYPAQTKVSVDTTHFICTRENKQNPEFIKANEMNIPIIRPEWLKACERDRRIVGVRDYYVKDCVLPDIFAKNFWNKSTAEPVNNKKDDTLPEIPEESPSQESPKVTSENNAEAPKITVEAPTDPEIQVTEATPESNSKVELKEEEASNGDLGNVKAEEEKVNEEVVEPVNEVSGEGEVSPEPKPKDTEEPAEATKAVDVVEEPVHPTEADVEEPVQPTEADIVEEPVQPTEADIVEEPVQSTKADVKEEPVQPTETDVKEEPVETSDAVADSINENRSSNDDSPKDEEPKEPSNEPKSETKSKNKNKKKKNKKK